MLDLTPALSTGGEGDFFNFQSPKSDLSPDPLQRRGSCLASPRPSNPSAYGTFPLKKGKEF